MQHPVDPIAQAVLDAIELGYNKEVLGAARCYIGASMAGTDCVAQMALSLRGFPDEKPTPKLKRVFFAGHKIEAWVVYDLKKRADLRVYEKDEMTGRQHKREWLNGHVVCHSDGLVDFEDGTGPAILEIKSMNDANFKRFKTYGVRTSHKKYFRQMTMMMAMFNIERSFFVSYNKDNSDYHAELVSFDQEEWDGMYVRIQAALDGQAGRVADAPENMNCKFCFKRESCWNPTPLAPACQFCTHSFANKNGGWTCKLTNKEVMDPCPKFEQFATTPKA